MICSIKMNKNNRPFLHILWICVPTLSNVSNHFQTQKTQQVYSNGACILVTSATSRRMSKTWMNMNKTFPRLWTSAPESHQIDFCSPPDKQVCIQHHLCLLVLWSVFLLQTDFFLLYILHKLTWANNGTWRVCVFVCSISCQLLTKCSTHQGNWFFLFFFPSHLCNVAFRK